MMPRLSYYSENLRYDDIRIVVTIKVIQKTYKIKVYGKVCICSAIRTFFLRKILIDLRKVWYLRGQY
jgi:hypothetical protein